MFSHQVDDKEALTWLEKASRQLEASVSHAIAVAAARVLQMAKQRVPVKTGKLQRSIRSRVSKTTATVSANAPYASFVENGTKPHTITAKGGGFLRFRVNGRVIFKRSVRHPGTRGKQFMGISANTVGIVQFPQLVFGAVEEAFG